MIRFSLFHPVALSVYFVSVFLIAMFVSNPFLQLLALIGGIDFFLKTHRNIGFFKDFGFCIALFVLATLSNPLFSHNGMTVLFFFNNNPITFESLLYGISMAVTLVSVVFWFRCFSAVMTADKLMYLFAKLSPKIAVLVSSALRFLPLLKRQTVKIKQTQMALGAFSTDSWTDKLMSVLRVYSALISWALENAIDTGASMKARGYGLKGRTHYSLFRFGRADALLLGMTMLLDIVVVSAIYSGRLEFLFYPSVYFPNVDLHGACGIIAFAVMCLLPFIIELKESVCWHYRKGRIKRKAV